MPGGLLPRSAAERRRLCWASVLCRTPEWVVSAPRVASPATQQLVLSCLPLARILLCKHAAVDDYQHGLQERHRVVLGMMALAFLHTSSGALHGLHLQADSLCRQAMGRPQAHRQQRMRCRP